LFKRGNKLSLRGMLPAKPTSKSGAPSIQQTIALDLYANAAGVKVAESEALKVSGLIALKQFDWGDYRDTPVAVRADGLLNNTKVLGWNQLTPLN
jgi:hypothetical protein